MKSKPDPRFADIRLAKEALANRECAGIFNVWEIKTLHPKSEFKKSKMTFFDTRDRVGRKNYKPTSDLGNTYAVVLFWQDAVGKLKLDSEFEAVLVSPVDYSSHLISNTGLSSLMVLATKKGKAFAKEFASEIKKVEKTGDLDLGKSLGEHKE